MVTLASPPRTRHIYRGRSDSGLSLPIAIIILRSIYVYTGYEPAILVLSFTVYPIFSRGIPEGSNRPGNQAFKLYSTYHRGIPDWE
jgi:hypothetical protein